MMKNCLAGRKHITCPPKVKWLVPKKKQHLAHLANQLTSILDCEPV
jgi:hypothetical protein